MKKRPAAYILPIILTLMAALALNACASREKEEAPPQQVILEPGLTTEEPNAPAPNVPNVPNAPGPEPGPEAEPEPAPPVEDEFVDLGRASTLNDLMDNKEKIHSYYFEQNLNFSAGEISVQTWYKDGIMKIVSSFPDAPINVEYYDCYSNTIITHTPSNGNNAVMMTFEEGDPDLPDNPLAYDYHGYRVLDTDSIGGQICRVLESKQGNKLWVSTKHGFPLQVEFNDPTNDEHLVVLYENIAFNQVQEEEVALPEDLIIYELGDGWGY